MSISAPIAGIVRTESGQPIAAREHLAGQNAKGWTPTEKKLHAVAGQLVGQAFFAPMLAQMRNSPFKDEKFSGGRGGEAFGQLLDQKLVQHMASGNDRLSNTIVKHFLKPAEHAEARNQRNKAFIQASHEEAILNAQAQNPSRSRSDQSPTEAKSHVDITG